jgi:iron(III) transport system substrate-binding protein
MKKFSLGLLGFLIFFCSLLLATPTTVRGQDANKQREAKLIDGAKKEGKLIFWDSGSAAEREYVFNKFRARYGFLSTEFWRGRDADIKEKIISEARAAVYNVDIAGAELDILSELKEAGVVKKYDWPNTRHWSPQYKDRDGYWIARNILTTVVAYNTTLVSTAQAPKSWEDLLDPKWKDTISMDKDGGEWVLMMWAAWGKEKTINYLKRLVKNNIIAGAGATQRTEMLAAGAYKIDLRLNLNRILDYQNKGAPLDWVRTNPILGKGTPIFIAAHAPHPNAAMLFADWFTSLEGQQVYYDASGKLLPDPRIKSRMTEALAGLTVALTPPEMAVHGNEAHAIFRDLFLK